jgi:hypothetical protein
MDVLIPDFHVRDVDRNVISFVHIVSQKVCPSDFIGVWPMNGIRSHISQYKTRAAYHVVFGSACKKLSVDVSQSL